MKTIKKIKISFLNDTQILKMSKGEVKKPETINYRTLNPEKEGLFCQKIFGPIKDYKCICKNPNTPKHTQCKICGVETINSINRRKRIGHIKLNTHVAHIWLFKVYPSKIGILINKSQKQVEDIIYYKKYIVTKSKTSEIKLGELIKYKDYHKIIMKFNTSVKIETGATAIKSLLKRIKITHELKTIKKLTETKQRNPKTIIKKKILTSFKKHHRHPQELILKTITVLPPELRPLINMGNNKFITSDLNELYKRIINRNNRIKKLKKIAAPNFIITNEKRLLQEAFDCLIENGKRTKSYKIGNKILLKSLADNFKGKKGRFRQNLLGKRVDYSGRAVIVVDPKLKIHQCKIPIKILKELFKPHIYGYIVRNNIKKTILEAIQLTKTQPKTLKKIIRKITHNYPIILNRAPTLHKLNLQAFKIIPTTTNTIKINPLICKGFNADFDGDQMAIHIPLTIESITEIKKEIMANKNIFSPANNKITIIPTQEILLGISYLTHITKPYTKQLKVFSCFEDVISYHYTYNTIHEEILLKIHTNKFIQTTVGRTIFFYELKETKLLANYNTRIRKPQINKLIETIAVNNNFNKKIIIKKISILTKIGFKFATYSGTSIALSDLKTIKIPNKLLKTKYLKSHNTHKQPFTITTNHTTTNLTPETNKYKKLIKSTNHITNTINQTHITKINKTKLKYIKENTLQEIIYSGAKGTENQMLQILNMRGLVMKSNTEIINFPIISPLLTGMNCNEFFVSTFGARKGLSDTSIKTSESGYITRKLVDVTQNTILKKYDCKTPKYMKIKTTEKKINHFIGKTVSRNIYNNKGNLIIKKHTNLTTKLITRLKKLNTLIFIRSLTLCNNKTAKCIKCYGNNENNTPVNIGSAIGIIAAQSIGEPGTQLTMRTFHTGGVVNNTKKTTTNHIQTLNCFHKYSSNIKTHNKYTINNGTLFYVNYNSKIITTTKINAGTTLKHNNTSTRQITLPSNLIKTINNKTAKYNITHLKYINIKHIRIYKNYTLISTKNTHLTQPTITLIDNSSTKTINVFDKEILIIPHKTTIKPPFICKLKIIPQEKLTEITDKLKTLSNILENRNIPSQNTIYEQLKINTQRHLIAINNNSPQLQIKHKEINSKIININKLLITNEIGTFTKYFIYKMSNIYLDFGIEINIKHFEIIIDCMLSNTNTSNKTHTYNNLTNYKYKNTLIGITRLAINSQSFISAASFQETIKIIINSAIQFKIDKLKGIKENVIIGSIVPIGTGFFYKNK
ncbi:hypothetical protein JSR02_00040 [Candidatus Vidania fulgoroideae]|uniref:DNA-directed RNA polymerase subunit n=1 Tax=Candidatus Vidania fulgoroideorum TaxID=881286 RepID=A0A974XA53_9PROT|nr:hypothetical protein JSR02_00040 [Candidatus Vidania fulgoroideae]